MKNLRPFLLCYCFYFLVLPLQGAGDYHTFTNNQGQQMKAKPLRMQGDKVEIQRDDGATFIVDPMIFTVDDQKYLKQWQKESVINNGAVTIKATSATTRKIKEDSPGMEIKRFNGYYKVKVENTSDLDFKELKVEYRYFVFKNKLAADKRSAGELKRVEGKYDIKTLARRSEIEFDTSMTEMMETDLDSNVYWVGGGKRKSEDELTGVWVRVYKDKDMISEFSYPSNLTEKESW